MVFRLGYKITLAIGASVALALIVSVIVLSRHQELAALQQNERSMLKLTQSVIQGLQSVMLSGSADIAQAFADRLKRVPEVSDFRVLRITGEEAFRDNRTIADVNARLGEQTFPPRKTEARIEILKAKDPDLRKALATREPVSIYTTDDSGVRSLTFLAPILTQADCAGCHGEAEAVRGVLKLTTSMAPVERDILAARQESLIVLGLALMAIMLVTGFVTGRSVVAPILSVTRGMSRVRAGDLGHRVPVEFGDELGHMAENFNRMTSELEQTRQDMGQERERLTNIVMNASEGIVLVDAHGQLVLNNPAAERMLGKSSERIAAAGIASLLDDVQTMRALLEQEHPGEPQCVEYRDRIIKVFVSPIHNADGDSLGSAVLLQDVSDEKRLESELRRMSTIDVLTGLYNRRHLDETLHKEFVRSLRTGAPLSIAIIQVDDYMRIADAHGKERSENVLRRIAEMLRHGLRKYDVACRYGGDAFLAILPGTSSLAAAGVAERLRAAVSAAPVHGLPVTVSAGVANCPELVLRGEAELVEAADLALMRARQAGRNRVDVAPTRPEPLSASR